MKRRSQSAFTDAQRAALPHSNNTVGRPVTIPGARTVPVRLTAEQIATARRLGAGNISAGVRGALDAAT